MEEFLQQYGYMALSLGTFLEGETAILVASSLAGSGLFKIPYVVIFGFFGSFVSDWIYFLIGKLNGKIFLEKRPKLREKFQPVQNFFKTNRLQILFSYRFLYGFRIIIPLTLGMSDLKALAFLGYSIAAGLIWRFVYDGDYGLLAKLWTTFGAEAPQVLAEPETAMYAIIVVIVWKYFGFHMILYIAGLQQIDKSLYEAAQIDGTKPWRIFHRITLPLLGSTIRLSIFFAILGSIQLFDLIMPLTKGGPSDSSQTTVTYLYNFGVTRMQIGYGSAVGVVLFFICVTVAFGYKRTVMRND